MLCRWHHGSSLYEYGGVRRLAAHLGGPHEQVDANVAWHGGLPALDPLQISVVLQPTCKRPVSLFLAFRCLRLLLFELLRRHTDRVAGKINGK